MRAQVEAFYEAHNIVFWRNVLDAAPYRTPTALLNVLFTWQLQPLTPLLVAMVSALLGGWLVGLIEAPSWLVRRASVWSPPSVLVRLTETILPHPGVSVGRGFVKAQQGAFWLRGYAALEIDARGLMVQAWWWLLRVTPLTLAAYVALVRITRDRTFLGLSQVTPATVSV